MSGACRAKTLFRSFVSFASSARSYYLKHLRDFRIDHHLMLAFKQAASTDSVHCELLARKSGEAVESCDVSESTINATNCEQSAPPGLVSWSLCDCDFVGNHGAYARRPGLAKPDRVIEKRIMAAATNKISKAHAILKSLSARHACVEARSSDLLHAARCVACSMLIRVSRVNMHTHIF